VHDGKGESLLLWIGNWGSEERKKNTTRVSDLFVSKTDETIVCMYKNKKTKKKYNVTCNVKMMKKKVGGIQIVDR